MGHRHYSVLHIARSDEAHYGPKSRQKPQTTGNNQGFALVMGKMLMCNQINLCSQASSICPPLKAKPYATDKVAWGLLTSKIGNA